MHRSVSIALIFSLASLLQLSKNEGLFETRANAQQSACELTSASDEWGPTGKVSLHAEKVITGLEVPWDQAFLPNGDWLITERAGRVRLVHNGRLASNPVLRLPVVASGEGGLLGLALDPSFGENRRFYVFYTFNKNGTEVSRVERFRLSDDSSGAVSQGVIIDDIPAGSLHVGGRIRFGKDGMLYVSVGDSQNPDLAQNPDSKNGKILRLAPDGSVPSDNPASGSPVYISGLRNTEAFDWANASTLLIADNGPTGEFGLSGLDEVSFASAGSNLGWPKITGCKSSTGLVTPILSWAEPAPPGGALVYTGSAIPEFNGNLLVGMLGTGAGGAMQLHRVVFDAATKSLISHEVYLQGQFGRLRNVTQGPDGALYVSTSNCDGRGSCPSDGDAILRITRG